jgi:hypothetical protein
MPVPNLRPLAAAMTATTTITGKHTIDIRSTTIKCFVSPFLGGVAVRLVSDGILLVFQQLQCLDCLLEELQT